jgi:EAL and modified HD-GYP domain-containing signal transduction protein
MSTPPDADGLPRDAADSGNASSDVPGTDLCTRLFARQPVFDEHLYTWGYAVTFGPAPAPRPGEDVDCTLDSLPDPVPGIAAGLISLADTLFGQGCKVLISFGERTILDETPYALPSERTVIEVPGADALPASAATALQGFRADGFAVALDLGEAARAEPAIRATADVLLLDMGDPDRARTLARAQPKGNALLLARGVDDPMRLTLARSLGANLVQGGFFRSREAIRARKATSHETSRFRLLAAIEQPEPDFDALSQTMKADAALSFRLLAYLNSPAFGFPERIGSLRQAMLLLGWKILKNWLRVAVLTDLAPDRRVRQLLLLSAQRAKFLELAATSLGPGRDDPDELFLLGLFSLLEPLLRLPMTEVAAHLPLARPLLDALTGRAENRQAQWLHLVRRYEAADWEAMEAQAEQIGVSSLAAAIAHYKASAWAEAVFSGT